jgi:sugar/nucleoside kinase (ribokinase family)
MRVLRIDERSPFRRLIGVGGIGSGIFFEIQGDQTLGRNESRPARLLDVRDYCKLHIVIHYVAKLLGARRSGIPFHVLPVGIVGDDAPGSQMLREMTEAGIDTAQVRTTNKLPTLFSVCFQYPDGAGGNLTTCNSAAAALSKEDVDGIEELLKADGPRTIALAVPEASLEAREHFLQLASDAGCFRAASFVAAEIGPARSAGLFERLDMVALNEEEAGQLVDCAFNPRAPEMLIEKCQSFVRESCPLLEMIVSVGSGGAYAITAEGWSYCPAPKVSVASTAGAGDSLLGGVLAAVAAGIPFVRERSDKQQSEECVDSALAMGVLLASYKCQSPHTIHPEAQLDLLTEFARRNGYRFSSRIEQFFSQEQSTELGVSS